MSKKLGTVTRNDSSLVNDLTIKNAHLAKPVGNPLYPVRMLHTADTNEVVDLSITPTTGVPLAVPSSAGTAGADAAAGAASTSGNAANIVPGSVSGNVPAAPAPSTTPAPCTVHTCDNVTQHYVVLNCAEDEILYNVMQGTRQFGYPLDVYNVDFTQVLSVGAMGKTFRNQLQFWTGGQNPLWVNATSTTTSAPTNETAATSLSQMKSQQAPTMLARRLGTGVGTKAANEYEGTSGSVSLTAKVATRRAIASAEQISVTETPGEREHAAVAYRMLFDSTLPEGEDLGMEDHRWVLSAIVTHRALTDLRGRSVDGSSSSPSQYVIFLLFDLALLFVVALGWCLFLYSVFRLVYPQEEEQQYLHHHREMIYQQQLIAQSYNYGGPGGVGAGNLQGGPAVEYAYGPNGQLMVVQK